MKKGQSKLLQRLKKPAPYFDERDGRWVAKVYMGNGKYKRRTCATRDECYELIEELWKLRSLTPETGQHSVRTACQLWLTQGQWKAKTREDYQATSDKFSPIADIPLDMLRPVHVDQLIGSIKTSAMKKRVKKVLGTMLEFCVRRKLVLKNVAREAEPVRHERELIDVFDIGEPRAIFAEMSERWSIPTELMFRLALRPGEVWGLQWRDWKNRQLTIRQNVKEVEGKQVIESTKTAAGRRTLLLDDHANSLIVRRREIVAAAKPLAPIFSTARGGYQRQGNYRSKVWKKALEQAGIQYRKPYTLRHTSVTWMLNSGKVSLAAVSKWIGHKSIETTLKHYAHLMVGEFEQVAEFWAKFSSNDP